MSRYNAYPEYKESGVEWLGEVPREWKLCPLKFMARIRNGQDYQSVEADEGYPVIGSGGRFSYASQFTYKKASVLLGRKGTIDKPLFINEPFWTVDTMYYTEINADVDPKYFYYLALTIQFSRYATNTALPSMTQENLGNYVFAIPTNSDSRKKIATFLDHETAKIDALIEKQQRLIELLKEKRQAVISHAVTKGLNPNAPMKDSGVEWLDEVPAHWGVTRAKFIATVFVPQRNKPELNDEEGIAWATMEDMKGDAIESTNSYVNLEAAKAAGSKVLKAGAVIASCVGNFGVASINNIDVIINQQLQAYIPRLIHHEYLRNMVLISKNYFYLVGTAATIVYVNQQGFENLPVLIPPVEEQQEISKYIQGRSFDFESLISKGEDAIQLMQERRTALISAAVTGKIDVRDWQAAA